MKVFATPDGNDLIIQPDPAEGEEEDAPQKEAVVDRRRALLVRAPHLPRSQTAHSRLDRRAEHQPQLPVGFYRPRDLAKFRRT